MPPVKSPKAGKGIPLPVWIGAGLFAVVVGYFFLRSNSSSASSAQGAAGTPTDQTVAADTYAAYLNQNSWLNSYLAQISQQLAGIASTQGASAPPNPTPKPPPNPGCCKPGLGILCREGLPYCPPDIHDGSGVISPKELQKVA